MAGGSVSQQLEDLLNPQPKFTDPEDDHDEQTRAKLVEKFDDDHEEDEVGFSALRKQSMLPETDTRYRGKAVSRKQLLLDAGGSGEEEEDDIDEDEIEEEKEDDGSDDDDGDDEEEEDEEDQDGSGGDEEDDPDENDEEGGKVEETQAVRRNGRAEMKTLVSKMRSTDITFPQGVDLHQLTEGMDDVGESESGEEESESGEEESEGSDGSSEEDDGDEDGVTVRTFSKEKVDEEVEKGQAVKDQLALWDHLLEGRIKIQKALLLANQLPQPQTLPEFKSKGGAEFAGALKNSHKALKGLQRSLLELQDQLLYQNPDTRSISLGQTWTSETQHEDEVLSEDEMETVRETGPPKRKLEMAEYPDFMAKRFSSFQPYRNATLQKWHDKTRLTMGKSSKGFGAFERNILTQVEQVLMDKERLLRRTQTKRSEFRVLGKTETTAPAVEALTEEGDEAQRLLKANSHLKDLDEDIFDDDDFYHQLLRELIERKTSAADPNDQVAMGRQWLAIQKLRSKIKKKVDTKASKGRKVRFHIHSKLVNFMAPVDHSSMNDDARTELYRCLFGGSVSAQPQVQEEEPGV